MMETISNLYHIFKKNTNTYVNFTYDYTYKLKKKNHAYYDIIYNDPPLIRSGGSVKKVLYNRVYLSTIFSILIYTFIPL